MKKSIKTLVTISLLSLLTACTSGATATESTSTPVSDIATPEASEPASTSEATATPSEEATSTEDTYDNLDVVYNNSASKEYTDLRELSKDYTAEQAIEDNCFVFSDDVYNELLYRDFMNSYIAKESAFIRVVHTTKEGDPVITDVLYDKDTDIVYVVNDASRDRYASAERATITLGEYETTGTWQDGDSTYWVAYNDELPSETQEEINEEDLFIIATIG